MGIKGRKLLNRRNFFAATAAAMGMAGGWTWLVEPHWVEFLDRRLAIPNLPRDLEGARLVQLSDLHIGPRVDDSFLQNTFAKVQALRPELVVYTGDFTSFEPGIVAHAAQVFPQMPKGELGTLGILGNHDYGVNWRDRNLANELAETARRAGVMMLRNEVAEVKGLQIAGLDDLWAEQFRPEQPLKVLNPKGAAIVLSHNPDTVDLPVWGDYAGRILCGHTHGGQCKPPFLPAPLLPVKNRLYRAGEYKLSGGRTLYINRGLGHLLKVRFNVRPEVTVFHLARA